jgi:nicotinamide/nicotinate riboside kinase
MEEALMHIRKTATFPVRIRQRLSARTDHGCLPTSSRFTSPAKSCSAQPNLESKEDQNTVGRCPVSDEKIATMKAKVEAWTRPGQPGAGILGDHGGLRMCMLDGFLLYCQEMPKVQSLIDIKLFLLVSREKATQRRDVRDGYVTLEGFWQDPPGYVDKIVWPNYAASHAWLFVDGNVEGQLDRDVLARTGIQAQLGKGLDIDFETTLEWAVGIIMEGLERVQNQIT